ncbi:MAG: hypothetical protein ACOXZ9_04880 [Bacteroidales bacterium]|jgi:hypothetical protein
MKVKLLFITLIFPIFLFGLGFTNHNDTIRGIEKQEQDSIVKPEKKVKKEKPYIMFIFAMNMLGDVNNIEFGQFTVFTNMDEGVSRTRFSYYLQDNGYAYGPDEKQKFESNLIQEYYVRRIAVNDEANDFIQVRYDCTERHDLPSYYSTILDEEYPCRIIDKVTIDGTANTIIPIYVKYWSQSKSTIGSDKTGVIASHVFMGDEITLIRRGQNRYRIEITKNGGGMDYYTIYEITKRHLKNKNSQ